MSSILKTYIYIYNKFFNITIYVFANVPSNTDPSVNHSSS